MSNDENPTMGQIAADAIIEDICDRRGLRQEWEDIDEEVQAEIRALWEQIVSDAATASWCLETRAEPRTPGAAALFHKHRVFAEYAPA